MRVDYTGLMTYELNTLAGGDTRLTDPDCS